MTLVLLPPIEKKCSTNNFSCVLKLTNMDKEHVKKVNILIRKHSMNAINFANVYDLTNLHKHVEIAKYNLGLVELYLDTLCIERICKLYYKSKKIYENAKIILNKIKEVTKEVTKE